MAKKIRKNSGRRNKSGKASGLRLRAALTSLSHAACRQGISVMGVKKVFLSE